MTNNILPPVEEAQSSTLYACPDCPKGTFDGAPLIDEIISAGVPDVAKAMDEIHHLLAELLITDGNRNGLHYANLLYYLRCVRNGVIKGAGSFEL